MRHPLHLALGSAGCCIWPGLLRKVPPVLLGVLPLSSPIVRTSRPSFLDPKGMNQQPADHEKSKGADLLLLFVVFENILNFTDERVESQCLQASA
jgi:hypothetical protein